MKFQRKSQVIDAYTFPIPVTVSHSSMLPLEVSVPAGEYLVIVDGTLSVMTKRQFHAAHDPVELTETRESAPRVRKHRKAKARGLKGTVLEQPAQQPNGAEQQP